MQDRVLWYSSPILDVHGTSELLQCTGFYEISDKIYRISFFSKLSLYGFFLRHFMAPLYDLAVLRHVISPLFSCVIAAVCKPDVFLL
jgi:hypothetical protein